MSAASLTFQSQTQRTIRSLPTATASQTLPKMSLFPVASCHKTNLLLYSISIVDLLISRAGISADDFTVFTSIEFAQTNETDTELKLLCELYNAKHCPSANTLVPLSGRIKSRASIRSNLVGRVNCHHQASRRPRTRAELVPGSLCERVIRSYLEGFNGAYQGPIANSKVVRCSCCPDLKRDETYSPATAQPNRGSR